MRNFSIISNNCWSNKIYERLNLPYQTPFVNIFFHPDCFLQMLSNLEWYLNRPLWFVKRSRHNVINRLREDRKANYPIAMLHDVELQCLHFHTEAEVVDTWARRLARMAPDESRRFYKFSDEHGCTRQQLEQFDALPFANKVCFTSKPMPHLKSAVHIPYGGNDGVPFAEQTDLKYFDAIQWLNSEPPV